MIRNEISTNLLNWCIRCFLKNDEWKISTFKSKIRQFLYNVDVRIFIVMYSNYVQKKCYQLKLYDVIQWKCFMLSRNCLFEFVNWRTSNVLSNRISILNIWKLLNFCDNKNEFRCEFKIFTINIFYIIENINQLNHYNHVRRHWIS